MAAKIKFKKQYKPMGFGDRDDKGSVEAHLRDKAEAKEMRQYNARMKELEAEDARRRWRHLNQSDAFLLFKAWDTMMDHNKLLALWNTEDFPACDESMMLAQAFLISAGEEVNRLGTQEPLDRLNEIKASYMAFVEHGEGCDDCNEV